MIYGLIPIAIAAIGVAYAVLVLKGARTRDNLVFGALALVDAAMTAWRGINVLAGVPIIDSGVLVPCTIGTITLALLTFEFLWAFPRRTPMRWMIRGPMIAWGALALALAARSTDDPWGTDLLPQIVFFAPATLLVFGLAIRAKRSTRDRAAQVVIGMLMFRWAMGFTSYFVGPQVGAFEELVWFETTVSTLVGFVVIGTAVLRGELFSIRSAAAEVVTIAVLSLTVALGGAVAVVAVQRWVTDEYLTIALCGATFVPLALAAVGFRMYPRVETRILAPLDERRARRLGLQDEPLGSDPTSALAEATKRIATIGDGATTTWEPAANLPGALVAQLADGRPLRRDETPGLLAAMVVPSIGGDGHVVGALLIDGGVIDRDTWLVARDLASRLALIIERAAAMTELEDARRLAALGQFAAAIAHDIRTPLTSISLNVQILRRKLALSEDDVEHLDIALEELARLDRSVAEILEFAKPVKLVSESIDVGELVDTTTRQLGPVLSEKHVSLRCEPRGDAVSVRGDRQRLRQVLVNLVDNAADASTPGAEVTMRVVPRASSIAIEVSDRGRGISEADLPRIFEPFFTTRPDGTGLGLSIVHKVVRAHGGDLEVKSTVGTGSTFTVVLPVEAVR